MLNNAIKRFVRMPLLFKDIFHSRDAASVETVLAKVYQDTGRYSFFQVGANDGSVNDNVNHFIVGCSPSEEVGQFDALSLEHQTVQRGNTRLLSATKCVRPSWLCPTALQAG